MFRKVVGDEKWVVVFFSKKVVGDEKNFGRCV